MRKRNKERYAYNENLKQRIRASIDNIDGCTREEIFTLEFIYGAVRKYEPQKGGAV